MHKSSRQEFKYSNINYNTNVIITYLILEAYSRPYQIAKIMRHVKNPGIVSTIYQEIFRHV